MIIIHTLDNKGNPNQTFWWNDSFGYENLQILKAAFIIFPSKTVFVNFLNYCFPKEKSSIQFEFSLRRKMKYQGLRFCGVGLSFGGTISL